MISFKTRTLIVAMPLIVSTLVNPSLLGVAVAQDGPPQPANGDIPLISYKDLVQLAHNQLAWQKYAGKTVGVFGARFMNVQEFTKGTYMMGMVSSQYTSDVSICLLTKDSVPVAANFKPNDVVSIIVKLAPSPSSRGLPNYDSPCVAAPGTKKPEPQAAAEPTGPVTPEFTITTTQYFNEHKDNALAADQKYMGKAIELKGKVGAISPKDVEITVFMYGRNIVTMDCFVNTESQPKLLTLKNDGPITVTGIVRPGDYQGARKYNPILSNCSIK
jgi:hypothetical protein